MAEGRSLKSGLVIGVVVLAAVAGALGVSACGDEAEARTPEAYCRAFYEKGVTLHDEYQQASDNMETDLLGGMITLFSAPGDLATLLDDMAAHAPDEIRSDTEAVRDAFKKQQDSMGDALTNPLGALGSGLATALTTSGSFRRVDEYLGEHCPLDGEMAREYGVTT